jgi:transcriptional regulator with XRE-family HTH domain
MTLQASEDSAVDEQPPPPRSLADLRRAAGLSESQVAQRMNLTKGRIQQIEARYPAVNYDTLVRYITALGGSIQFTVGTTHTYADQIGPDPDKAGTRAYLQSRPGMGKLVYQPSAATEELPLQSNQTEPGSDDPGRHVDHPDTQGDQRDSGQSQQT